MRPFLKIGIVLASLALAVLAFPISTAAAHEPEQPLIFKINTELSKPKPVLGPHLSEVKPKPQKPVTVGKKPLKKNTQIVDKSKGNKFAAGYCTDYVSKKLKITWRGNANRWIANAKAQGYNVDKFPTPGDILVTNESRWGHVAYIESVEGDRVTFSEWNYAGRYQLTYRTLSITSPVIAGVIHL